MALCVRCPKIFIFIYIAVVLLTISTEGGWSFDTPYSSPHGISQKFVRYWTKIDLEARFYYNSICGCVVEVYDLALNLWNRSQTSLFIYGSDRGRATLFYWFIKLIVTLVMSQCKAVYDLFLTSFDKQFFVTYL